MSGIWRTGDKLATKYGLPLADVDNVFDVLKSLGIVKLRMSENPMPVSEYLKRELSLEEKMDLKYLLKVEVVTFTSPKGGVFRGFRSIGSDGVVVFTLLPGSLVVVCGEFMHGREEVILDLPGGMIESGEDPSVRAKKEFEEESGVILKEVILLGSIGTTPFARQCNSKNYSFMGIQTNPVIVKKQNLDENEYLGVVLVHLDDWLKLIDKEVVDGKSVITTFRALRKLKLIKSLT